ncbi:MAG: nucleoside hydrolase [Deltaproteobacteria bacterium]|nr:nucleoside hydrolase [Deltaproteobacteria bacterium]
MTHRLLLDTDIGSDVDDAIAMGVLFSAAEEIELIAVTTVAGNTEGRAWAAARMLGLAGFDGVEVCVGAQEALARKNRFAWRDIEMKDYPEGPDAIRSDEPAAERIARAGREEPGFELVAIGPLTNLAHALALDPELPSRVSRLTIMGGHIREVRIGSHLCKPGIDYNLCSDPEATVMVLGAGFPIRLVSADVTLQTWMREQDLALLAERPGPVPGVLVDQIRRWTPFQQKIFTGLGGTLAKDNVAFLHDPLTMLSIFDASALHFEELRVVPTVEKGILRTIEVPAAAGLGATMQVATTVDAPAARDAIMERLLTI